MYNIWWSNRNRRDSDRFTAGGSRRLGWERIKNNSRNRLPRSINTSLVVWVTLLKDFIKCPHSIDRLEFSWTSECGEELARSMVLFVCWKCVSGTPLQPSPAKLDSPPLLGMTNPEMKEIKCGWGEGGWFCCFLRSHSIGLQKWKEGWLLVK